MPTYRVVMTRRARADLDAVHDYIAADSPDNAARMTQHLLDAVNSLEELPLRYAVIATRRKLGYEPRAVVVRPYRVIYSVEGNTVRIRTIRHGARRPWP